MITRRHLLGTAGAGAALVGTGFAFPQLAQAEISNFDAGLPAGTRGEAAMERLPGKQPLIKLTYRPPNYEAPIDYFKTPITPNDRFFVRYHLADIPEKIDAKTWKLVVGGDGANGTAEFSLADLKKLPAVEVVAVNQCSGNSRGFFEPRVAGGQLGNGAMGNARWRGVRLKDVLAKAEPRNSARQVTFNGLDTAIFGGGDFVKALDVGHAMDGEVIIAWQMNGADIPMLNGYPVKLIVPGYYGTYWVKHLSQIDVVDHEFDGFWMKPAYRIPDNDCACVVPGTAPKATRPIGKFTIRSFVTSLKDGQRLRTGASTVVRGIAFDGGSGIKDVGVSTDGGKTWQSAFLGEELGRYSFREFSLAFTPTSAGVYDIRSCAWGRDGTGQPTTAVWQPGGYMRNVIESVKVTAA